jgi:hypothetical protein
MELNRKEFIEEADQKNPRSNEGQKNNSRGFTQRVEYVNDYEKEIPGQEEHPARDSYGSTVFVNC